MSRIYFGQFSDYENMKQEFTPYNWGNPRTPPDNFPEESAILFASYGGGSYDGDALVLFERDGKLVVLVEGYARLAHGTVYQIFLVAD